MGMESLSMAFSASPPLQTPKPLSPHPKPHSHSHSHSLRPQLPQLLQTLAKTTLLATATATATATTPLPCSAAEPAASPAEQLLSDKVSLEAILVAIDDFFNRNPFFVAGCTFIWLIVIPLTQEYLRKYKFVSAIDAFRRLRDDPSAQLLDIRVGKSLRLLKPPNLKLLSGKTVAQVQFSEDDPAGFVKAVLEKFDDPGNTVLCILDDLDGNSLKAAELLFKSGFKEAYGIKGGVAGKKGWLEIQEQLLPPSVHIVPRKKKKAKRSKQLGKENGGAVPSSEEDSVVGESRAGGDGDASDDSTSSMLDRKPGARSSSPFPNYPDLKPPSSPTPSKPSK